MAYLQLPLPLNGLLGDQTFGSAPAKRLNFDAKIRKDAVFLCISVFR